LYRFPGLSAATIPRRAPRCIHRRAPVATVRPGDAVAMVAAAHRRLAVRIGSACRAGMLICVDSPVEYRGAALHRSVRWRAPVSRQRGSLPAHHPS